jgi:hypothetical protein
MVVTSDYLTKNKDFEKFVDTVSDNTGRTHMDEWIENLRDNRELFRSTGWATDVLQGKEEGKTSIIMGASPAIANQIETLKGLQDDNEFVLCGLSSNLEYLLNNGIKPKYIITVDGDVSQGEFFDRIDMDRTNDITLIANCYAYPPMLKKWKGPLYFLALQTGDAKFEKKLRKWYGKPNGLEEGFPSIMAQFNIITAFSFLVLQTSIILFVGHELSFKDDGSKYYVDREDKRDKEMRFPHGDIYGNKVHTTMGLLAVKYSLEGFLELIKDAGWFINCTEAGIFGITKRFPDRHVPWIRQLTLRNGIAQARQIMRTGEPFYTGEKDSRILVPNMLSRVSLRDFRRFK